MPNKDAIVKKVREFPLTPGVYLMKDREGKVLYVGKAKNLRRRLGSYRVANPDRMPPRHLRMLQAVARIELEPCSDERTALARESELLRALKPDSIALERGRLRRVSLRGGASRKAFTLR
jgi:excinuclease ABC subunit C